MVQRTKRSLGPGKAAEMQAKVQEFHHQVRRWCGEIPVGGQVYMALDVLNFALHMTNSQLIQESGGHGVDPLARLYRSDVDAGE
ncbi:hypothetical protein SAMN05421844_101451 [Bosea robiniae]|uniref:Uncharacterized protein n=1 Tax=Bosea robiniae TaxID=1036780 RepID=A0ABY0NEY0_9HYPH|nr:hypothetical protein SAMN05421844_101451 [Bosea robiniae]